MTDLLIILITLIGLLNILPYLSSLSFSSFSFSSSSQNVRVSSPSEPPFSFFASLDSLDSSGSSFQEDYSEPHSKKIAHRIYEGSQDPNETSMETRNKELEPIREPLMEGEDGRSVQKDQRKSKRKRVKKQEPKYLISHYLYGPNNQYHGIRESMIICRTIGRIMVLPRIIVHYTQFRSNYPQLYPFELVSLPLPSLPFGSNMKVEDN